MIKQQHGQAAGSSMGSMSSSKQLRKRKGPGLGLSVGDNIALKNGQDEKRETCSSLGPGAWVV